jgi:cobalamin biosynthesis Mg chelatase CobN
VKTDRVFGRTYYLVLPALCLAAFGCAGNTASPVDARAAGEWTFRLPETRSPYAGLAIDRGGPAIAQNDQAKSVLDDSTTTVTSTGLALAPVSKTKAQPKSRALLASARTEDVATSAPSAAPATTPEVAVEQPEQLAAQLPAQTTSNDAERYSDREAKSEKQSKYRGGDAIVISASALVIILLVVILVIVLT